MRRTCILRKARATAALLALLTTVALPGQAVALTVRLVSTGAAVRLLRSRAAEVPTANATQGSGRIAAALEVSPTVEWSIATSGGSTTTDPGIGSTSLSGLNGIASSLIARLANDRLLLQGTVTVPSTHPAIRSDQLSTVETIGLPYLGFDVKHHGNGLEYGGTVALELVQRPMFRLSVGGGGLRREAYRFIEDLAAFLPASEWAATAGFDLGSHAEARPSPLRTDATIRAFGADRAGGVPVFHEGARVELRSQFEFDTGALHWAGFGLGVLKRRNTVLDPAASGIINTRPSSGNDLYARVTTDFQTGSTLRLGLVCDETASSGSDNAGRNGALTAIGPLARIALRPAAVMELTGQFAFGTAQAALGPTRRLTGFAAGMRLTWSPGD